MSGSVFDPPLWSDLVVLLVGSPWVHGPLAALLFTTIKLFVKENL